MSCEAFQLACEYVYWIVTGGNDDIQTVSCQRILQPKRCAAQ